MVSTPANGTGAELKAPVRNRYFYGKRLDVFHFELEQEYFNQKRWLINQRVVGYGVVCGLDVTLGRDSRSVVVQPGLAIDRCGREIVVAAPSSPVSLDPWLSKASTPATGAGQANGDDGRWVHLCLCYHECESDPEPAFGGDCDVDDRCAPGAIRERYRIDICEGRVKTPQTKCRLSDLFSNRTLDYAALARFVTRSCPTVTEPCCIPIANIQLPQVQSSGSGGAGAATGEASNGGPVIDITVRPIVITNPLLYQLLICLCGSGEDNPCGGGGSY